MNHDPVMTLTYFRARSTGVAYAVEWVKLLKCYLKGKTRRKLANGQDIDYSEKKAPGLHLSVYTHIPLGGVSKYGHKIP